MAEARVSIVMAALNEGEHVARTVDAILTHTLGVDIEIVLVDDGSTDGSFDFLSLPPYQSDPRLRCYRFERSVGCIRARHQGARLSTGTYLLFMDAHMTVASGWLKGLLEAMARHGDRAAVTPNVSNLERESWTVAEPYRQVLCINDTFQFEWRSSMHPGRLLPTAGGACVMLRRDFFWEIGGFDLGLRRWGCEFVDLILKVYARHGACYFVPEVVVGHLYREVFPYPMSWNELTYNTLRVGYLHLSDSAFRNFFAKVRRMSGFAEAWRLFREDLPELEVLRDLQRARLLRDPDFFVRTFLPSLLEDLSGVPLPERRSGTVPRAAPVERISVVIPVRNEGIYLRRTLKSLLETTDYPELEVVIVDDGSDDGCCDFLLMGELEQDRRIRVVRHDEQRGYVARLNEGVRLATGEILKFLDAHHSFSPGWLESLYATLVAAKGEAVVGAVVTGLEPQTWQLMGAGSYGFGTNRQLSDVYHLGLESLERDRRVSMLARYQMLVTREVFEAVGGFRTLFRGHGSEDFDFCLSASAMGWHSQIDPTVRLGHLPRRAYQNVVTPSDLLFNRLLLAYLHLGPSGLQALKARLVKEEGYEAAVTELEQVREGLESRGGTEEGEASVEESVF